MNWVKCKVVLFWIPNIFLFVCLSNYSSNLLRFSTWIKLTALSGEELHIAINCYSSVVLIQLKFNLKEKLLNESELLIFKVFPRLHRLFHSPDNYYLVPLSIRKLLSRPTCSELYRISAQAEMNVHKSIHQLQPKVISLKLTYNLHTPSHVKQKTLNSHALL